MYGGAEALSSSTAQLFAVVTVALIFDLMNGFHDGCNAVSTVIYTKALKPRFAIGLSAMFNIIGNATSAILNRPPSTVYKSGAMFDLEVRMLQEMLAVMKKLRLKAVDLPGAQTKRLANAVNRLLPSMYWRRLSRQASPIMNCCQARLKKFAVIIV